MHTREIAAYTATPPAGVSTGADPAAVGPYLADALGDARWAGCDVSLISGGKSNLTYVVSSPAGEVVLRRPPLGAVLATAHDMGREYTVLAALAGTPVPVPRVHVLCRDESVLGAPFYVMDRVAGHIIRTELPPGYADEPAQRQAMGQALVDVLAAIHAVDVSPRLDGFAPPQGYLARQMRRWNRQWEASKQADLPALDSLAADLGAALPEQRETTLVHGDYRLDNTLMHPTDPGRVAAVLDWELSTLGDPLADLGLLLVYWAGRTEPGQGEDGGSMIAPSVTALPGFPDRAQVTHRYATVSGRDVSALPWYVAFAYFKLAVVSAGIAARHRAGAMIGEGFDTAADAVLPLVTQGRLVLDRGTVG